MTSIDSMLNIQFHLLTSVLKAVKIGVVVLDSAQRVVLWNQWMEQHSRRPADTVIGKSFLEIFPDMVDGRIHIAIEAALANNFASLISQSLNKAPFPLHATATDADKDMRLQQAVQVMPIEVAALARHCVIQITDVSMAVARDKKLREQAIELQSQTFSDGLTGIANRRRLDVHLDDELRRAKRIGSPLSLIMIDIDYFKHYNDNYGHQRGDQCLILIAAALSRRLGRPGDLVARYGGEEFMAILPDTSAEGASLIAEGMRADIEKLAQEHAHSDAATHVTVSLGVVTRVPQNTTTVSNLIEAADRALYHAKNSGRNRVVVYNDSMHAAD